ncbi:MAG: hypothetical protein ACUVSK_06495 [Desulfotomaculales bacterium]
MTMTTSFNLRLDGKITLLSPLSHIGESIGTDSYLSEDLIIGPDGKPIECFTYSGNAFRGLLRDLCAAYMSEKLGVKYNLSSFYLLFSGGMLESSREVDVDLARKIRQYVPMLSVFGGSIGQQILRGKVKIGPMYPIVQETARVVPGFMRKGDVPSWLFLTYDKSFSRKDDLKDCSLSRYILEDVLPALKKKDSPQQMRYTVELLAAGTDLYQRIDLCTLTELELGAFVSAFEELAKHPYIGGKSAVGCGLICAEYLYRNAGDQKPTGTFAVLGDDTVKFAGFAEKAKREYDHYLEKMREAYLKTQGENDFTKTLGVVSRAAITD